MVDACHYAFAQSHRMYDTESEPCGKLRTLGDEDASMQGHQLLSVHHLLGDADAGGVHCRGHRGCIRTLCTFAQFFCDLKTGLKNKVYSFKNSLFVYKVYSFKKRT